MKTLISVTCFAKELKVGDAVQQYSDSQWGARKEFIRVAAIRPSRDVGMLEIELRDGPILRFILRLTLEAKVVAELVMIPEHEEVTA